MSIPTRSWTETDAMSQRILDAATAAFATKGFAGATMADVAGRCGEGVGSIHRQFGGMRELFVAVFDRLMTDVDEFTDEYLDEHSREHGAATIAATVAATCAPTSHGEAPPAFTAAVRGYLEAMWWYRDVAVVFTSETSGEDAAVADPAGEGLAGEDPAGFPALQDLRDFPALRDARLRSTVQRWIPQAAGTSPQSQLLSRMLTAILSEASSLVVLCDDTADIALISDATIEAIDRLIR